MCIKIILSYEVWFNILLIYTMLKLFCILYTCVTITCLYFLNHVYDDTATKYTKNYIMYVR